MLNRIVLKTAGVYSCLDSRWFPACLSLMVSGVSLALMQTFGACYGCSLMGMFRSKQKASVEGGHCYDSHS